MIVQPQNARKGGRCRSPAYGSGVMSMVEVKVGGGSERSVGGIVTPEVFSTWSGTPGDARSPGVVGRFGHVGFLQ